MDGNDSPLFHPFRKISQLSQEEWKNLSSGINTRSVGDRKRYLDARKWDGCDCDIPCLNQDAMNRLRYRCPDGRIVDNPPSEPEKDWLLLCPVCNSPYPFKGPNPPPSKMQEHLWMHVFGFNKQPHIPLPELNNPDKGIGRRGKLGVMARRDAMKRWDTLVSRGQKFARELDEATAAVDAEDAGPAPAEFYTGLGLLWSSYLLFYSVFTPTGPHGSLIEHPPTRKNGVCNAIRLSLQEFCMNIQDDMNEKIQDAAESVTNTSIAGVDSSLARWWKKEMDVHASYSAVLSNEFKKLPNRLCIFKYFPGKPSEEEWAREKRGAVSIQQQWPDIAERYAYKEMTREGYGIVMGRTYGDFLKYVDEHRCSVASIEDVDDQESEDDV